jgi:hypothetical protein
MLGILSTILFVSCEHMHDYVIQNKTPTELVIFIDGNKIGNLTPDQQLSNKFGYILGKITVSAKDLSGKTVYSKEWSADNFIESKWKVVITSP